MPCSQLIRNDEKNGTLNFTGNVDMDSPEVPLNTKWTFWTDNSGQGYSVEEFKAKLHKIYTVDTVQSFWSVFNNIPNVEELRSHYSYHMMRDDRPPLWEDERNLRGGSWKMKLQKKDSAKIWRELLLAAIGEQFCENIAKGDDIIGISICVREKDDVVQIWNVDASLENEATVMNKVQSLLPRTSFISTFYKPHKLKGRP